MKRKRDQLDHTVKKPKLYQEINASLNSVKAKPKQKKKKSKNIALETTDKINNKITNINLNKLHKTHRNGNKNKLETDDPHSKNKKGVHFEENVEVKIGDSSEKTFDKLKEDLTDSSAVTNIISQINSHNKSKNKKSKKARKVEKLIENSKLVQEQSMEYLKKWKNNKTLWKFEKAKQNRLLNYMFDNTKLPQDMIPIFIDYINGSKGNITKIVSQKCSLIIKEMEDYLELTEEEQSKKTKPNEAKYERARSILQGVQDFTT